MEQHDVKSNNFVKDDLDVRQCNLKKKLKITFVDKFKFLQYIHVHSTSVY